MIETSIFLIPLEKGGAVAFKAAFEHLMRQRVERARRTIVRRISKGKIWAVAEDDMFSMIFTLLRNAEEGVAAENLDLLAQAIANGEHEPTLVMARFRRWHRALAEMSREEILVLGRYLVGANRARQESKLLHEIGDAGEKQAVSDLVGPGKPLQNGTDVRAHLTALQRLGVVAIPNGWDANAPVPTTLLSELAMIVNFDEAAKADDTDFE